MADTRLTSEREKETPGTWTWPERRREGDVVADLGVIGSCQLDVLGEGGSRLKVALGVCH